MVHFPPLQFSQSPCVSLQVYVRALFDYVPLEDKATPCQEAGLPFKRGDILQVVTQDDQTWWQAKRVGDSNLRAGLIPSKQFQERSGQTTPPQRSAINSPWCKRIRARTEPLTQAPQIFILSSHL